MATHRLHNILVLLLLSPRAVGVPGDQSAVELKRRTGGCGAPDSSALK